MTGSGGKKLGLTELNAQIMELVKESIESDGVINIFTDKKSKISLFDAAFLAEIKKMETKNLAVEILRRLLEEHISKFTKRNVVKSEEFSALLSKAMNEYINGHITNEEVIKRLIELANSIKSNLEATPKKLTEEEVAFYDALSKPEAVKLFMDDEVLIKLTKELTEMLRKNRTIDWNRREAARASMRTMVKRLLRKYGYPPKEAANAMETVMRQCELWVDVEPVENNRLNFSFGQTEFAMAAEEHPELD